VADQMGLAVASSQLSDALQERRGAEVIAEIAQAACSLELDEMLELALGKVLESFAATVGAIYLWDELTGRLTLAAHRGLSARHLVAMEHVDPGEGVIGRVKSSGCPELIDDLNVPAEEVPSIYRDEGLRSMVVVPLRARSLVIGAMALATRVIAPFQPAHVAPLTAVGHQVALAVENARLLRHLARAKQEWEMAFDSIADGIVFLDGEGTIRRANRAFGDFWNVSVKRLIGASWHQLFQQSGRSIACPHCEALRSGAPALAEVHLSISDRSVGLAAFPIQREGLGTPPAGAIVVLRDIGERKRREEEQVRWQVALRRSAREWQHTFDSVDSPILIVASDRRIVRLNRAAMELIGKSFRDIIGQPLESCGTGEPWAKGDKLMARVLKTRTAAFAQSRSETRGKTWDITAALLIEPGSEEDRVILLIRDITRMVELQASLHRSETMAAIGALAAGVCHEVRNPLFSISATLDAFEARFGEQAEYAEYLLVLRRELTRLNDVVRDLLEYSKPPSVTLLPDSIENVVAQAVHSSAALAKQLNVKIVNNIKRAMAKVPMDRRRLLQVFQNLIENAVQHSPPGGSVALTSREFEEEATTWIECGVLDSGPGFQEGDLPRIFEPFYSKRRGGTGLGLSIVQRIVEEHHGQIIARNRPEGGAMVLLRFAGAR